MRGNMKENMNIIKVETVVPMLSIGDAIGNAKTILELVKDSDADVILTPELSLVGYTIQDAVYNKALLCNVHEALMYLSLNIKTNQILIVGAPLEYNNALYNCAVVIQGGWIAGIVPKQYIPNYSEFYEKRYFSSGKNITDKYISIGGIQYRFGVNNVFNVTASDVVHKSGDSVDIDTVYKFGVELCEDLWAPNPPSTELALSGAQIIFNLSASNETIGKAAYRKELVKQQSARTISAYVYCSAGTTESVSDIIFGGHQMIMENGKLLSEVKPFENGRCTADIDLDIINHDRMINKTFADSASELKDDYMRTIKIKYKKVRSKAIHRDISITPFVPKHAKERCKEIFAIQTAALASRLRFTGSKHLVVGVSGGLDSTLALLVAIGAMNRLGRPHSDIIGVTMPCFGTTDRTKNNAIKLMEGLGCSIKEVNIANSVKQHLADIGLSEDDRSVAYENAQARERTQVLMDIANMEHGFVLGTGDLSELALGWCTYNGDHMSMYNVNGSIPKTLIRTMVENVKDILTESMPENEVAQINKIRESIDSVLNTPISPELLPPDKDGKIAQLTEDSIGPYVLNDFFLFYTLRYGFDSYKIRKYCIEAIRQSNEYKYSNEDVDKWLGKFYKRFASSQFKRNCCPDGIKVGSVSFSPRGDWRMPTELSYNTFS